MPTDHRTVWPTFALTDIFDVRSGLSKPASEFGSGFPFITFKDVLDNYFLPDTLGSLVRSSETERELCDVRRGDVFLTRTSETQEELGMSCVALRDYEDATFNGFTKRLRPKNAHQVVPEYAAYYLRSPRFRSAMSAFSSLSTRASLNNDMLSRLEIVLPDPKIQEEIGYTLRALDDKVEQNRRTAQALEALARTTFKAWFVDFEPVKAKAAGQTSFPGMPAAAFAAIPDRLTNSPLGPVPEGWDIANLGSLCTVGRGASPRPINNFMGGTVPWLKIADATAAAGPFLYETKEFVTEAGATKSVPVAPGDLILSNSASCGIPIFVGLHGCIHDGWLHFRDLQRISKGFLYQWLNWKSAHLIHIADGSVQKNLNTKLIKDLELVVPLPGVNKTFGEFHESLFNKINSLGHESRRLVALREYLLPLLLSGRVRVSNVERFTSEAP